MERFGHKPYLNDCLKTLHLFFTQTREFAQMASVEDPASVAFHTQTKRLYHSFGDYDERLAGVPAVCLRVPTGGGKTALGARAIKTTADSFLATERPWVLWLVPSTTIRDQTLRQMRDRSSGLRQLLDEELGAVLPLDMRSALELSTSDANNHTIILVSTLATSRVEKTENRRFYRENGALMAHFEGLSSDLEARLELGADGKTPIPSLCNLIRLHRPIVIVDEAHNNKSSLGFETLGRVAPCAIIEFTATPDTKNAPANVLHYVMASQLKAAQMIKMPLLARQEADWKRCLAEAKAQREDLERVAAYEEAKTGEFLRPVALIGAEKKNERYTVDVVIEVFTQELLVPRDQIAIATGDKDEIGEQKVGTRESEIRYIVTVDKLREGWDCPPAYVLASVREMKSATAIEQLVGRILRMPNAQNKHHAELNKSYAFLRSSQTLDAIHMLKDALVNNGFSRPETDALVEQLALPVQWSNSPIPTNSLQGTLNFNATVRRAEDWRVPLLCLDFGGEMLPMEPEFFLPGHWDIRNHPAVLTNAEIGLSESGGFEFDVVNDRLGVRQSSFRVAQLDQQLKMLSPRDNWRSSTDMALWLDRTVPHRDISPTHMRVWLAKLCGDLESRVSLRELEVERMRARRAVMRKLNAIRLVEKQKTQLELFEVGRVDGWGDAILSDNIAWELPPYYAPPELYNGHYRYSKHAFDGIVGHMNGEEAQFAWQLDHDPKVKYWFRNVEKQPGAFWLPTMTDKFYPDFLALLESGHTAVIEYKGKDRISNDDSREK
ncbi:MAG: DEAD/DEAH box helicase family protein, partial [Armatimonadetes bacterium]|nr:DEAD/DEAH box helicase family protein [Armatimonadota bacterium]